MKKTIIFVLYDGIENSVFQSQVLFPLVHMLENNMHLNVILISFEQKKISLQKLHELVAGYERITILVSNKIPFVGKISLLFATRQFKKLIKKQTYDEIIARGPLAGFIVLHALRGQTQQPLITIQARGLCAEEYRYAHKHAWYHSLKKYWLHFIYQQLYDIEKFVFTHAPMIETVSPALQDYLVATWQTNATSIVLAERDIPQPLSLKQVVHWKEHIKRELEIPQDAIVYCYSGSFKPWQCAQESIEYVIEQYHKDSRSFLLILSQDKKAFEQVLEKSTLPSAHYLIRSVAPQELTHYLAAADFGLLFREPDIINWVSRPTKMLEYQTVGLKIIHNDTIAWLAKTKAI